MHLSNLDSSARGSLVSKERYTAPQRCDGYHYRRYHGEYCSLEQPLISRLTPLSKVDKVRAVLLFSESKVRMSGAIPS